MRNTNLVCRSTSHTRLTPAAASALSVALIIAFSLLLSAPTASAQTCKNRGELDTIYCDNDGDMLADTPTDPKKLRNPSMLLYGYTPTEDTALYEKLWQPYIDHMTSCTGKPTRFFKVHSAAATIEALRSGRIHVSQLSAGDTPFAVNIAGAQPFAIRGDAKGPAVYRLVLLVKKDSPFQAPKDLKDKRIAHVTPTSNSGNLAPRALFPAQGLTPDKDYKVLYSGKHDNSVAGVMSGDYDAAAVADDVWFRMIDRGMVKADDLRVIFRSKPFPPGSAVVVHDLLPELKKKIADCTINYRFTPELTAAFRGTADRHWPLDYKEDYDAVRAVAKASGEVFTREALAKRAAESAAGAKK
ncbi:MAG: phosphate/phosphite/phosphonate ABC transporter substrate-binding protein [Betaproteobacteria bacterium]